MAGRLGGAPARADGSERVPAGRRPAPMSASADLRRRLRNWRRWAGMMLVRQRIDSGCSGYDDEQLRQMVMASMLSDGTIGGDVDAALRNVSASATGGASRRVNDATANGWVPPPLGSVVYVTKDGHPDVPWTVVEMFYRNPGELDGGDPDAYDAGVLVRRPDNSNRRLYKGGEGKYWSRTCPGR